MEDRIERIENNTEILQRENMKMGFRLDTLEAKHAALETHVIKTREEIIIRLNDLTSAVVAIKEDAIRRDAIEKHDSNARAIVNLMITVLANVATIFGTLKALGII